MPRIAYAVLCHSSMEYVRELYQILYARDTLFFFHADEKSPPNMKALIAELAIDNANVTVLPSRLCSWAGFSLTEAMLDLINASMRREGWSHLVFLSEQHLPLRSNDDIAANLDPDCNYLDAHLFADMWVNGQKDVIYRTAQLYFEVPGVGAFGTIPVTMGGEFFANLYHGTQWMALCRTTCAKITASLHTPFWEQFRHSVLSDENAIQSFVAALKTPGVTNKNSITFIASPGHGGSREMTFDEPLYFSAREKGYLFIRKRPPQLPAGVVAFLQKTFPPGERRSLSVPIVPADAPHGRDLAAQLILSRLNDLLLPRNFSLESIGRGPARPAFFCRVLHHGVQWPFGVYVASENLKDFKVLAIIQNFPEEFGFDTLGGYRVGMVRARLAYIAFQGEIHLATDYDHGFVTVETLKDLERLTDVLAICVERILPLKAPAS